MVRRLSDVEYSNFTISISNYAGCRAEFRVELPVKGFNWTEEDTADRLRDLVERMADMAAMDIGRASDWEEVFGHGGMMDDREEE